MSDEFEMRDTYEDPAAVAYSGAGHPAYADPIPETLRGALGPTVSRNIVEEYPVYACDVCGGMPDGELWAPGEALIHNHKGS